MKKVVPIRKNDVQETINEIADMGMTEIAFVGRKADGGFHIRLSPCENAYIYIGMLEMLKQEFILGLQENSTEERE